MLALQRCCSSPLVVKKHWKHCKRIHQTCLFSSHLPQRKAFMTRSRMAGIKYHLPALCTNISLLNSQFWVGLCDKVNEYPSISSHLSHLVWSHMTHSVIMRCKVQITFFFSPHWNYMYLALSDISFDSVIAAIRVAQSQPVPTLQKNNAKRQQSPESSLWLFLHRIKKNKGKDGSR